MLHGALLANGFGQWAPPRAIAHPIAQLLSHIRCISADGLDGYAFLTWQNGTDQNPMDVPCRSLESRWGCKN
jgi:hypothetical protein